MLKTDILIVDISPTYSVNFMMIYLFVQLWHNIDEDPAVHF